MGGSTCVMRTHCAKSHCRSVPVHRHRYLELVIAMHGFWRATSATKLSRHMASANGLQYIVIGSRVHTTGSEIRCRQCPAKYVVGAWTQQPEWSVAMPQADGPFSMFL